MDKPNRAERRKNKFGGGRATEHGGWPTVQPNPVFVDPDAADEPEPPRPEAKGTKRSGEPAAYAPEDATS